MSGLSVGAVIGVLGATGIFVGLPMISDAGYTAAGLVGAAFFGSIGVIGAAYIGLLTAREVRSERRTPNTKPDSTAEDVTDDA